MDHHSLFYVAFLSQVFLISYFLPRNVLTRMRHVVATYPPETHPRLYPVPLEEVERAQRSYWNLNRVALIVGIALVAVGLRNPTGDMLGWDTLSVMSLYLLLQLAPLLVVRRDGFIYFSPSRLEDTRRKRTADLTKRRLSDLIPLGMLIWAVVVYLAFTLFIIWVNQFDYSWFGGYWNIAGISGLNLFMVVLLVVALRRRRRDPYQTSAGQDRRAALTVWVLLFTSIAATLSLTLSISLAMLELRPFVPLAKSLYFMLLAIACFREFRIDGVDFEVYREEPFTGEEPLASSSASA